MRIYDYICPECGGQMVLRKNRKTGNEFYGCVAWPDCSGTRDVEGTGRFDRTPDAMPSERAERNDKGRWRRE